jgi:hypothetical protein
LGVMGEKGERGEGDPTVTAAGRTRQRRLSCLLVRVTLAEVQLFV